LDIVWLAFGSGLNGHKKTRSPGSGSGSGETWF
jgi:hypothetical protein